MYDCHWRGRNKICILTTTTIQTALCIKKYATFYSYSVTLNRETLVSIPVLERGRQLRSSDMSPQLLIPLQVQYAGTQRPLSHWNWPVPHVAAACTNVIRVHSHLCLVYLLWQNTYVLSRTQGRRHGNSETVVSCVEIIVNLSCRLKCQLATVS